MPKVRILPFNLMLLTVALADLLTTLFWLRTGQAVEVNPIMAGLLHGGLAWFVLAKLATLAAYVGVVEWYRRRRNPDFARAIAAFTLFAYVGIYAVSFCCVNYRLMN